ncbi:hypothetical protein MIND_00001600 [Mycena indigotica]|uniref:Uncharacterized protein n=1 Tax=Mycena indigotica TaxID=2126181 RepID=A0A8H6WDP2_9AGAR|nr:uncharacterized protein MIND_00000100 [Mycena indigotica]XP_037224902.1 uncharacterized protein MIND_00001600 [Mycena indigotica]KAF7314865.1 hypothetical protein MIND_00000100 [Mycena indigotica]KAF7314879.1 hypothetical protein MIND_00001600 [Mycena indigotica]
MASIRVQVQVQQSTLDRAAIRTGMDNFIGLFHELVPRNDPRWRELRRQDLFNIDTVIRLGIADCRTNGWVVNAEGIVQALRTRLRNIRLIGVEDSDIESVGSDSGDGADNGPQAASETESGKGR